VDAVAHPVDDVVVDVDDGVGIPDAHPVGGRVVDEVVGQRDEVRRGDTGPELDPVRVRAAAPDLEPLDGDKIVEDENRRG
jgi:hypothetical protein